MVVGVKERYDEEGRGGLPLRFQARTLRSMWPRMSSERVAPSAAQASPYSRQRLSSTRTTRLGVCVSFARLTMGSRLADAYARFPDSGLTCICTEY